MNKPVFQLRPECELVLASTSPRRKELLSALGLPFASFAPSLEEPDPAPDQNPGEYALLCARLKNQNSQKSCAKNAVILSADTIVAIDDKILGKPANAAQALDMLLTLNGKTHTVFTAFWLRFTDGSESSGQCRAQVTFKKWPAAVLQAYAASGEPMDKAGAYAIQGKGVFLVESIKGSWTTVVGLPMAEITDRLLQAGVISYTS